MNNILFSIEVIKIKQKELFLFIIKNLKTLSTILPLIATTG